MAREPSKHEILRDSDRASDLALDPEDPIDVVGEGAAEVVVAEARTLVAGCVEGAAARNDGGFDRARTGRGLLRVGATGTCD